MSNICVRFYEGIIRVGELLQSPLLLAMRLFWGYQFFQGGMGKLANIANTIAFFQNLGIPFAEANAYMVGSLEAAGGMLLMLGLASRLVSIPLIITMCTAYATAHREALLNIFQDPDTFISQGPFNFLLMCLIVLAFGPGKFSLDALIERMRARK